MLKRAWFLVSPTTIGNCFQKAGFILEDPEILDNSNFGGFIDDDNDNNKFIHTLHEREIASKRKLAFHTIFVYNYI